MEIRRNDFKLKLKEGAVKEYEKIILSQMNDIFMPMGFISSSEGEIVSYNCSGYSALRQCRVTEVREALEILEKTFILVSRAGEYLISPSKITLSLDTIFYDRETKDVRIAYVPVEEDRMSLRENMSGFISEMKMNVTGTGQPYLERVRRKMEENNYYIHDLINAIGEIKRAATATERKLEEVMG